MGTSATSVAVYRRRIRASLERIRENALDWEHLPWLHRASFSGIELIERDARGWRARIGLQPAAAERWIELELRFEPSRRRYVSRTLEGNGKGTEIWTDLEPVDDGATDIAVEFLVPAVSGDAAAKLGAAFTRLYTTLWDEDEAMMVHREAQLAARRQLRDLRDPPRAALDLGPLDEVRARLPLGIELAGRAFRIVELDGELLAHSTVCPHMLGPLEQAELDGARVRCPWHGYSFDVRSGESLEGRRLHLGPAPHVRVDPDTSVVSVSLGTP
jgi:nitrite reductase/ring-hydroxylating ferredoxin subunit